VCLHLWHYCYFCLEMSPKRECKGNKNKPYR
jgi:hypothetical protein